MAYGPIPDLPCILRIQFLWKGEFITGLYPSSKGNMSIVCLICELCGSEDALPQCVQMETVGTSIKV